MAGITRTEADATFTEAFKSEVLQVVTRESAAMQTIRTVPMSNKKDKLPVLSTLPTASFLAAEGDVKPESNVSWDSKYLTAEEIAVIVPIDDSVLADSQIDIAGQVTSLVGQEFARVIDAAVFFGTNAPASWPTGGLAANVAAEVTYNDASAWARLYEIVEDMGHDVDSLWATRRIRAGLRNPIIGGQSVPAMDLSTQSVYGVAPTYPLGWPATPDGSLNALAIAGDSSCAVLGMRQDLSINWSTEATLTDYGSLWEKDATALRAVMRVGFVLADHVNIETGARTLPLAGLLPPSA